MTSSPTPPAGRRRLIFGSSVAAGALVASCIACTVVPGATFLPRAHTAAAVQPAGPTRAPLVEDEEPIEDSTPIEAALERPSFEFEALQLEGVRGGSLTFELAGSPEQVLEMLLDFEHAEGHRSWAKRFDVLERGADTVVARWHFRGRFGINPKPELEFRTERSGDGLRVDYKLRKTALGLAAFFGVYELRAAPGGGERTYLTERVYIDSGIKLSNASHEDIAKGLADDAARMQAWMLQRLAADAEPADAR